MTENLVPEVPSSDENIQTSPSVESSFTSDYASITKEEIISKLKALLAEDNLPPRTEIESLKQAYYKLRSQETDALKAKYMTDNDGVSDGFVVEPDPSEEELKQLLNSIKEKRAKAIAEEDKIKEDNLAKKLTIIDKIQALTESTEDFGKLYKEFKDLQQNWNDIKLIPQGQKCFIYFF